MSISYVDDLVRAGVPVAEARRRAGVEFGGIGARKEDIREALGLRLLDEVTGDLRYAFRQLRRAPAFTAVAVLSLALGIGANTAIFSLMEAALWKSIPVQSPEELRLFSWVSGAIASWTESTGTCTGDRTAATRANRSPIPCSWSSSS